MYTTFLRVWLKTDLQTQDSANNVFIMSHSYVSSSEHDLQHYVLLREFFHIFHLSSYNLTTNPTPLNPRTAVLFTRSIIQRTLTRGTVCNFCHPYECCFNFWKRDPVNLRKDVRPDTRHRLRRIYETSLLMVDVKTLDYIHVKVELRRFHWRRREIFGMTSQRKQLNDNSRKLIIVNFVFLITRRVRDGHEEITHFALYKWSKRLTYGWSIVRTVWKKCWLFIRAL